MKRSLCIPTIFFSLPAVVILARSANSVAGQSAVDMKPFTITVTDGKTGSTVNNFAYRFAFKAPGSSFDSGVVWRKINSPTGTLVLSVPHSCALTVRLKSPESVAGDRNGYSFLVRSTDEKRRATVELQPGTTVRGIVRDAITRRPIEGAVIVPTDSGSAADQEWLGRRAKSGPEGRYELRGVDLELGVTAYHPRYGGVNHRVVANTGSGMRFDVFLTPVDWETLKGIVRDPNGRPLEGVEVFADGAKFLTGRDGAYSVDYVIGRKSACLADTGISERRLHH